MDFRTFLKNNIVYLDGAMGTMLQTKGLTSGELPERWNLSHPDIIKDVHKAYYEAGSNVVSANTFGANLLKFDETELEQIIKAAVANANAARIESAGTQEKFIALDIGPTGRLLEPFGDLSFENAVSLFAKTVAFGVKYGVDLIIIETMSDSYETKAAVLAAKENSDLPILVSNAYGGGDRLMMGATPETMVTLLEGLGVDALGANCSFGPKQLASVADKLLKSATLPVLLKPNAGLPQTRDGKSVYDVAPSQFAEDVASLMQGGVRIVGGCCGTSPEYIKALCDQTHGFAPTPRNVQAKPRISSSNSALTLYDDIVISQPLVLRDDIDDIINQATDAQDDGAQVLRLDISAATQETIIEAICQLQAMISLPLCFDCQNAEILETALRNYNGKAMVVAPNERKLLDAFLPITQKYGGVLLIKSADQIVDLDIPSDNIFMLS